jgi:hypothetical protein
MNAPLSPPDVIVGPTKQTLRDVWSPQLRNRRDVDVYLPATYSSGERHPVVYMHDGQNLSDPSIAFAGTWSLEEVLASLAPQGIEPIVVGVHNTKQRLEEYSPYPDEKLRGGNGRGLPVLSDSHAQTADRSTLPHACLSVADRNRRIVDGWFDQSVRLAATS